jgi:hypothetical protein
MPLRQATELAPLPYAEKSKLVLRVVVHDLGGGFVEDAGSVSPDRGQFKGVGGVGHDQGAQGAQRAEKQSSHSFLLLRRWCAYLEEEYIPWR